MARMTKPERELDAFVRSLPDAVLQCRARYQHRFPDWMDTRKTHAWKERHTGVVMLESDCENGCGTFVYKIIGPDGVVDYSRTGTYDYTDEYKMPKDVRGEFTRREILAAERLEWLRRRGANAYSLVDDLADVQRKSRKTGDHADALLTPPAATG